MKTQDTIDPTSIQQTAEVDTSTENEQIDDPGAPVTENPAGAGEEQARMIAVESPSPTDKVRRRPRKPAPNEGMSEGQSPPRSRRGGRGKGTNDSTPSLNNTEPVAPTATGALEDSRPTEQKQEDLRTMLGLSNTRRTPGGLVLEPVRVQDVAYVRVCAETCFRAQVHWAEGAEGKPGEDVLCLGSGCPVCAVGDPAKTKFGVPVVLLNPCRLGLLTYKASPRPGPVMLNTVQAALRSVLEAGLGQHVLLLQRMGKFGYQHRVMPIPSAQGGNAMPRGVNLGDDLIRQYEAAIDRGELVIRLGLRLCRREILERYPQVAQASALGEMFGGALPSDQENGLVELFGTLDGHYDKEEPKP